MGLSFTLTENKPTEVYWANITHNLTGMAGEAGIYHCLWRPEEIGAKKAKDIIPILTDGLAMMLDEPDRFKKFNTDNEWGTYDQFVPWVEDILQACIDNPDADIRVSR